MYNQESQGFYDGHPHQEPPYHQAPIKTNQIHQNTLWILGLLLLMLVLGYFLLSKEPIKP